MRYIHEHLADGVMRIVLNRPEKVNAFNEEMAVELQQALTLAGRDEVRCVLMCAEGRAFSAGQDLSEVVERQATDPDYAPDVTVRTSYNPIVMAIRRLAKPVVCAVQGTAAGVGANIALACDLTLAARDAVFVQVFRNIGLIPDGGGTYFLPRLVGLQRANALYLLDERLSGEEAAGIGLIWKAVDAADLENEAMEVCGRLANLPTRGFGLYKQALLASATNSLEDQLELEARLQAAAGSTADCAEGIRAFLEKRPPRFTGS